MTYADLRQIAIGLAAIACSGIALAAPPEQASSISLICNKTIAVVMAPVHDSYTIELQERLNSNPGPDTQFSLDDSFISLKIGNVTQLDHVHQNALDPTSPAKMKATWELTENELLVFITAQDSTHRITIDRYTGKYTETMQVQKSKFVPRDVITIIDGECRSLAKKIF